MAADIRLPGSEGDPLLSWLGIRHLLRKKEILVLLCVRHKVMEVQQSGNEKASKMYEDWKREENKGKQ